MRITDGVVTIRSPGPGDAAILIAGRDDDFRRWMGEGAAEPAPVGCIVVDDDVVGWVDFDFPRDWLEPGEVNVGYNVFAAHRDRGYVTRAVQLLMHRLALEGVHHTATLAIEPENERSVAVASRAGFTAAGHVNAPKPSLLFKKAVPPLTYTDGVVTIRPLGPDDLDADLEAKDDEQIDWLWLPGQRETWEALTPGEQRAHALRGLVDARDDFGNGPKWRFAADTVDDAYVVYVDCDLANDHVPAGEANISYSAHPAFRGRGYVSRAVRLVVHFLADHTGAREAHILVDERNANSLRVARAVGAREVARFVNDEGHTMVRHVLPIG